MSTKGPPHGQPMRVDIKGPHYHNLTISHNLIDYDVQLFHHLTQKTREMPLRKVRKFYQVSLPARLSKKFGIAEGDYVEMEETEDGILVKPVTVTERVPAARLTLKEQRILEKARAKMAKIKVDLASAKGLTKEEARVAAKAGLIDPAQAWW
jgi:AbrB family looped-hinge helix DNA binding protein